MSGSLHPLILKLPGSCAMSSHGGHYRICRYMFPVTEEIRQFLLNDHLYIRYSSGCCRTTSELKLKSDIPPYLLVPGSHHPRFAASFPYGLLSPSQLFLYTLSIIGWGKSICQVFLRDFLLLYVCSFHLNGIFTDCKWFFREESGILLQNLEGKNTAFH